MIKKEEAVAVVVAGGSGKRFGGPKQIENLRGKPLLYWSLAAFQSHPAVNEIILVLKKELIPGFSRRDFPKCTKVLPGGPTRQESVAAGLAAIKRADVVLIHDGARPFPGRELISRVIEAARKTGAAVPGISIEDTLKEKRDDGHIQTVDRRRFFRVQTPQGFRMSLLRKAMETARQRGFSGTDDVSLVEQLGADVEVVEGGRKNIKITSPWDLQLAEVLFEIPDRNRL